MDGSLPNPDLVGDQFWGVFKPQMLRLALEIDLFSPLVALPATAEIVARTCQCALPGIRALLDYFSSLGILEKEGDQYSLTFTAETFLVPGRKAYVGDMIMDYTGLVMYNSVLASLRSGQPSGLGENFVQDAWLESYSAWRIPNSLEMWRAAGVAPGPERPFRLLDVACGCAIKSLALAQASPTVQVTCLDSPEVLEVARDLAQRLGHGARVAYQPADLLQAELGSEQYDAVLIGQITHYLTEGQNQDLFRRIYGSLVRDGVLVIDCPMLTDPPDELASFLTLFLWANSGGAAHRFEEYRGWLHEAGFRDVTQLSERWLRAMK